MNQNNKGYSWKSILMMLLFTIGAFLAFNAIFALILLRMDHFERYYAMIPWACCIICAILLALICKNSVVSLIVSSAASIVWISLGLIGAGENYSFFKALSPFCLFILSATLLPLLLQRLRKNNRKNNPKFRFSR